MMPLPVYLELPGGELVRFGDVYRTEDDWAIRLESFQTLEIRLQSTLTPLQLARRHETFWKRIRQRVEGWR